MFIFINLVNFLVVIGIRLVVLIALLAVGKKTTTNREQGSSFECGFNSSSCGLLPFSLQFYLIANIFLIFDVELILLFPIAVKLSALRFWLAPLIFIVLVLFLSLGLFHEWNQKMLDWAK